MAENVNSNDSSAQFGKTIKALLLAQIGSWKLREQIELLDRAEFAPREMASMLGTTSNIIRARLTEIRKEARAQKG